MLTAERLSSRAWVFSFYKSLRGSENCGVSHGADLQGEKRARSHSKPARKYSLISHFDERPKVIKTQINMRV